MDTQLQIRLRLAEPRDAPNLATLSAQLGYPVTVAEIAGRLEKVRASSESDVIVATSDAGHVVGWTQVATFRLGLVEGDSAQIVGLVVDERFRRSGIGRRLVEGAAAWAGERGFSTLSVRSNVAREGAHDFYPSLGFTLKKTQRCYAKQL